MRGGSTASTRTSAQPGAARTGSESSVPGAAANAAATSRAPPRHGSDIRSRRSVTRLMPPLSDARSSNRAPPRIAASALSARMRMRCSQAR